MNIFILDHDPVLAAQYQCDSHVVKMVLESAQMLSTAHRVLDGNEVQDYSSNGRRIKRYVFNDIRDEVVYKAAHINHPCTVWTRQSSANYAWHVKHFNALATEFRYRFGKNHSSWLALYDFLKYYPEHIPNGKLTPFAHAFTIRNPIASTDSVDLYRHFYQEKMHRMPFHYTRRSVPNWLLNLTFNP